MKRQMLIYKVLNVAALLSVVFGLAVPAMAAPTSPAPAEQGGGWPLPGVPADDPIPAFRDPAAPALAGALGEGMDSETHGSGGLVRLEPLASIPLPVINLPLPSVSLPTPVDPLTEVSTEAPQPSDLAAFANQHGAIEKALDLKEPSRKAASAKATSVSADIAASQSGIDAPRRESETSFGAERAPASRPSPQLDSPSVTTPTLSPEKPFVIFLPLVVRNYDPAVVVPRGGDYASPDGQVTVTFSPGAVSEAVRLSYEEQEAPSLSEDFSASAASFALEANAVDDGAQVREFNVPLQMRVRYDDSGMLDWLERRLKLWYYDEVTGQWEALPTVVDVEENVATAWTTHFTDFALMASLSGNPCDATLEVAPSISEVCVDEDDWSSSTIYEGNMTFNARRGTDIYLASSADGGDSLHTNDYARVDVGGHLFEHNFGEDGGAVGPMIFSAPPPNYVNDDIVYAVSVLLKDEEANCYSTDSYILSMRDTTPPQIRNVTIWQDGEGGAYIEAEVVDNCVVASVEKSVSSDSGSAGELLAEGGDGAAFALPRVGINTFTIVATDAAGNSSTWSTSLPALYSGAFGWNVFKDGCPPGTCGVEGEPVNTASGNFAYHTEDLRVPGVGATDIVVERGYNSQSVGVSGDDYELLGLEAGPFGPGWTFPFAFRMEFVDNLLLRGVKMHYPDGRTARFADNGDGTYTTLSPGVYDTLSFDGSTYTLKRKDLTEYHFDAAGRMTGVADPNGNTQTLTYNAEGQVTRVENSAGRWMELAYTAEGLISAISAPEVGATTQATTQGATTQRATTQRATTQRATTQGSPLRVYTYTDGLLTAFTDARGQTWQYSYDESGRLTAILTPRGHPALQLSYDEWGRVQEQIEGAAARNTFSYDNFAHTRAIVDANGHTTTHLYDDLYRLIAVTDARGYAETYDYDEQDRRVYFQDKEGREWHYTYDEQGNLILEEGPLGWERAWAYNDLDRMTMARDPLGRETRYGYDDWGNPTVITNALGFTAITAYDARGLPVVVTDFNGHAITHTYDAQGNRVATENAVGAVTRYGHDGLGRTTVMTNPNGGVYTYTYDLGSELLTDIYGPLGGTGGHAGRPYAHYGYDANGNLAVEVDANGGATYYEYDASENLVVATNPLSFTTVYTYGPMNELLALEDAEGRVTTYEYDAGYNLAATHALEGADTFYTYDGVGHLLTETDAEGRVTRYVYDDLDRLVARIQNGVPGGPENADTNVRTAYEYDLAGNLVRNVDANGVATAYSYDALNRQIARIRNARADMPADVETNVTTRYAYDPMDNLIRQVNGRGYTTAFAYDAVDRLVATTDALTQTTTYAYDLNDNLLQVTDNASRLTLYEYDALDRRTAVIRNYRPAQPADAETNLRTEYEYDLAGNLRFLTDPRGVVTEYRYDAAHRRVQRIQNVVGGAPLESPVNVVTLYEYDRVDNPTRTIDANGHATTYTYDGLNRLVTVTNPEGHTVQTAYDRVGNLVQITDAKSQVTRYEYDALNRVVTTTDALSGITALTYDPLGNRLARTDANGHTTTYTYDPLYRLRTVTDAEGYTTAYEYDENGNRVAVVDGNGHRPEYTYDPLDRLASATNAEGETTQHLYDAVGNETDRVAPDGVVTHYAYDGVYRLAAVTLNYHPGQPPDAATNVTYQFARDPNGNLTQITDPLAHVTTYAYDGLNQLTRETNPLGSAWTYESDGVGNRLRRVDANGHETTYTYYPDNQLRQTQYDDGTLVAYAYDANNNRTVMTDTLGVTAWSYDALNRVTAVNDSLGRALGYTYDAVGDLIEMVYPDGNPVAYTYYDNDWLKTMVDPTGRVTSYERDGVGNITQIINPNSTVTDIVYDRVDRVLTLVNRQTSGARQTNSAFEYTYNEVGHATRIVNEYGWRNPAVVTETYTYDPLRRLAGMSNSDEVMMSYAYDSVGNRLTWATNDDLTTQMPWDGFSASYAYDTAHRLLTATVDSETPNGDLTVQFTSDANGNRVNKLETGRNGPKYGTDYTYDRENRLVGAQDYQLVNHGNRVDRAVTTLAYDGSGRRLVQAYDPKGGGGGEKRTEYVFDDLDPVAEYFLLNGQREHFYRGAWGRIATMQHFNAGASGQMYWYHYNFKGDVVGLTKHQGQSTHNYRYDPYGGVVPAHGNFTDPHNHYTLTGKEYDEHTGLVYFGARHYDPVGGVWLTRDLLRGRPREPRSLHRYAYVFANPVNFVDPYGLQCRVNILTGETECFGDVSGMGQTRPMPTGLPSVPVPTGAQWGERCLLLPLPSDPDDIAAWEEWYDFYMTHPDQYVMAFLRDSADITLAGAQAYAELELGEYFIPLGADQLSSWWAAAWSGEVDLTGGQAATLFGITIGTLGFQEYASQLSGYVAAGQIRFAQDSIKSTFKDGSSVQGLIDDLKSGRITADDVPPIRVFERNGKLYSLDNRRLYAFQEAGVPIRVVPAMAEEVAAEAWKFTTKNDGTSIRVRGR